MNRTKFNVIIDILAAITFIISSLSGLILFFALPSSSGFRGNRVLISTNTVLALGRHEWINLHNISSIALLLLIIIHLIAHWQWIKKIPKYFKNLF